jgi:hypothetical protein
MRRVCRIDEIAPQTVEDHHDDALHPNLLDKFISSSPPMHTLRTTQLPWRLRRAGGYSMTVPRDWTSCCQRCVGHSR